MRKLTELPTALIGAGRWQLFIASVCCIPFIEVSATRRCHSNKSLVLNCHICYLKYKKTCRKVKLVFSFFQAKCAVGLVYELINEVKQAARLAKSSGNQIASSLKEFAQMMSENVQVLNNYPECSLQESANFPDSSAPAKAAQVRYQNCIKNGLLLHL